VVVVQDGPIYATPDGGGILAVPNNLVAVQPDTEEPKTNTMDFMKMAALSARRNKSQVLDSASSDRSSPPSPPSCPPSILEVTSWTARLLLNKALDEIPSVRNVQSY